MIRQQGRRRTKDRALGTTTKATVKLQSFKQRRETTLALVRHQSSLGPSPCRVQERSCLCDRGGKLKNTDLTVLERAGPGQPARVRGQVRSSYEMGNIQIAQSITSNVVMQSQITSEGFASGSQSHRAWQSIHRMLSNIRRTYHDKQL